MVTTPCDDPDELHTCYAVRYADGGGELAFAADAQLWLLDETRRLGVARIVEDPTAVAGRLAEHGWPIVVGHFHTNCFEPDSSDRPAGTMSHDGPEEFSIAVDGRRVAGASSSRSDEAAAGPRRCYRWAASVCPDLRLP